MKFVRMNLNNYIRVKLTDTGRKILSEKGLCQAAMTSDDGYTSFQLWGFMMLLGEYFGAGNVEQPCEMWCEVQVETVKMEERDIRCKDA